jgi:hypothetical protein
MKTSTDAESGERSFCGADDNLEEQVHVLKHMQAAQPKKDIPFIPHYQKDDFWTRTLDAENLFPELHF